MKEHSSNKSERMVGRIFCPEALNRLLINKVMVKKMSGVILWKALFGSSAKKAPAENKPSKKRIEDSFRDIAVKA